MIKTKRESLEQFIKEQLIGPGGCKGLYSLKPSASEDENSEELGEVVSTTPGSIYSSAILFPPKKEIKTEGFVEQENSIVTETIETPKDGNDQETELEEITDTSQNDDEDLNSLSRRFPSSMGVSCCLDSGFSNDNDLKIIVSGRYYTKVEQYTRLEVIVEEQEEFESFFKKNADVFNELFVLERNKLSLRHTIPQSQLSSYKENFRALNIKITAEIAQNPDGSVDPIFADVTFKEQYRYFSSYKERLFKNLSSLKGSESYLTVHEAEVIKKRIEVIERNETFFSYIEDLIAICDSRNFGYWVEHLFEKELDLRSLNFHISTEDGKVIYSPQKNDCLKNIISLNINESETLSLSVWLQLIKTKDDRTYLKILLNNSSTEVNTDEQHYYSIVSEIVNERCLFGVKVDASSKHLCQYKSVSSGSLDDEEAHKLNFLYRNIEDYGVGHLCSVDWNKDDKGLMHVFSEFMPSIESPDVEPVPRDKSCENVEQDGVILPKPYLDLESSQCLQFKWLSFLSPTSDTEILNNLLGFLDSYKSWIQTQRDYINSLDDKEMALQNVKNCEVDYERMKANVIEFLTDSSKMKAFRVMNAAMFMQLWHNKKENQKQIREDETELNFEFYRKATDDIFPGVEHAAWRPFQLAFILLNLDGIFKSQNDLSWSKRNELVDLVWFPTGGGKTEAYLGLIALTIINRRLTKCEAGYGVTAIMRYTLRLLTTQQFQRALRLILALEQVRLWELDNCKLGDEEISIGLFVGDQSLPNSLDGLKDELRKNWESRTETNNNSKIPLDLCPWCGSKLKHQIDRSGVKFYCENPYCTFDVVNAVIPVRLCDDDIYKNPPTLLFGTVDKFAQLAHKVNTGGNRTNKDSRRLFGRGENWNKLTPDLIIQDELHLLLGPLGSAVSLFECAIDQLCTRNENGQTIRPKIISSTATTRNTALQVRALYDRGISIFPKNGIDYDDSFFAFYKRSKMAGDKDWSFDSKRKYIGVMPTGRTQMTTQMRLAAILFVHRAIFEKENLAKLNDEDFIKAADYYFTTISYFNSLKEVGKTDAQFYMEFTKYTRRLFKRVMRYSNMLESLYAYNERFSKSELTGRLSGNEAVAALNKVQSVTWNPKHRFPYLDKDVWQRPEKPDDFILATNMISVGLDVSRFNTIIINSMPRNIAEYIQASSRVARNKEGLVLTLHNPFRSRDVSHFEKFREFHEKLYYYVEPISITPFSHKSVEKYLPLFLGTYIRHLYPALANNQSAINIDSVKSADIKKTVRVYFEERLKRTSELSGIERELLTTDLFEYICAMVYDMLDQWLQKKEDNQELVYTKRKGQFGGNLQATPLYSSSDDYDEMRLLNKWKVPTALRLLEPEAVIHIIK
ncbi:MAG: helicase-related protein [Clostridia bacterium]